MDAHPGTLLQECRQAGRKDADVSRKATAQTLDVKDSRITGSPEGKGVGKAAAGRFLDADDHSMSGELAGGSLRPAAHNTPRRRGEAPHKLS